VPVFAIPLAAICQANAPPAVGWLTIQVTVFEAIPKLPTMPFEPVGTTESIVNTVTPALVQTAWTPETSVGELLLSVQTTVPAVPTTFDEVLCATVPTD
jgi:hypothetical protein